MVGLECNYRLRPDVLVDTTGAAFIYPLFRMINWHCKVVAYVHYPIISSDMLQVVREQRPTYNNAGRIASNVTVSSLKLFYYHCFAAAYAWTGSFAHTVLVNSSWTRRHISSLWNLPMPSPVPSEASPSQRRMALVYPPCNTAQLSSIPVRREAAQTPRTVISIGQFRPEKDHLLQIRAIRALKDLHPS